MKRALIVKGGWDGHEPDKIAVRFKRILEELGLFVDVSDTLSAYDDLSYLKSLHIICPVWTDGELNGDRCKNIVNAVASGVGMGGVHGGMCDSFRTNTEWQFLTGGNWVSHPGGIIEYAVNIRKDIDDDVINGIDDFKVTSEQYYMHVDPAVKVLATTRFPIAQYFHISNGEVDMPVVWKKMWGNGRVFYTSLGHTDDVFEKSPESELIVKRGFKWAIEGKDYAIENNITVDRFLSDSKNY